MEKRISRRKSIKTTLLVKLFFISSILISIFMLTLWQDKSRQIQNVIVGDLNDNDFVRGFHESERSSYFGDRFFRWTKPGQSRLSFSAPNPNTNSILNIWLSVPQYEQQVAIKISNDAFFNLKINNQIRVYRILLPKHPLGQLTVAIDSPPYRTTTTSDPRELGVVV